MVYLSGYTLTIMFFTLNCVIGVFYVFLSNYDGYFRILCYICIRCCYGYNDPRLPQDPVDGNVNIQNSLMDPAGNSNNYGSIVINK